jgi:FtsP/CotA-like multicopper oxidase with cupredoxin domain
MLRRSLTFLIVVLIVTSARIESRGEAALDVFPTIPEVRSIHGVASVTLDVVLDPTNVEPTFEYDGVVGVTPTIRVYPGDTIAMTVHNAMPAMKGQPNDVNVHFHGMIVSPHPPGDEVVTTIAPPGGTLHYLVKIPRDHEPGLYWYHPHAHGETYRQVTNGMSGAIVVEGIQQHLPALQSMRERIIVLRDVPQGPNAVDEDMPMSSMTGMSGMSAASGTNATPVAQSASTPPRVASNATNPCRPEPALQPTLNRELNARIGIRPGEKQFFRVVNASSARYFDLSVDGSMLGLVARDGVPLDAYPGTPPVEMLSHVLVPPASRVEFVVTGPSGPSALRSACFNSGATGDADPPVVLATLVNPLAPNVSSAALAPSLPSSSAKALRAASAPIVALRVGKPLPDNWLSRPLPAPAAHRTIRFTEDANGFYLNGKGYVMGQPPSVIARSGTVEEWTLVNETPEVHDFHFHQVHFVPETLNGAAIEPKVWSDTLNVPPRTRLPNGRYVPGRATLIVDFRDPVVRGTFPYHCHILDHEDQGMMALIKVI